MAFSFDSIGERIVSFKAATNADVGYPCAVTDNDTVGEPADQGDIIGVVRSPTPVRRPPAATRRWATTTTRPA